MKISSTAWRQATLALLRYTENQRTMQERVEVATSRGRPRQPPDDPEDDPPQDGRPLTSDPTQEAAIWLAEDAVYLRAKREYGAVASVIQNLTPSERSVVEDRYFVPVNNRKPVKYLYLQNTGYSERQMKRIVKRVIIAVAKNLGEI